MSASNPNLLNLFLICNNPSSNKFELFCRYLLKSDVYLGEYFDEDLADKYFFPEEDQSDYFYSVGHPKYCLTEFDTLMNGYNFGTFDSYEEAVKAAKSYSAEELLEMFFAIHKEAIALCKKETFEIEECNRRAPQNN